MIKQMWHNVSRWGILQLFFKIKMISKGKENGRAHIVAWSTRKFSRKHKHISVVWSYLRVNFYYNTENTIESCLITLATSPWLSALPAHWNCPVK